MLSKSKFVLLAVVAASLSFGACKNPGGGGVAGTEKSCDDFVAKLCEKAGDKSVACGATKETVGVLSPAACATALRDLDAGMAKLEQSRGVCNELTAKLCKDVGPDTESCKMVQTQTPSFPVSRCKEMTEKYTEVVADLKKREAANQPLAPEVQASIAKGAPAFGPADAKVTLVEFSDFECPYCSRAANITSEIKKKYGDKVRFVFRQFPLNFHKKAHLAAQASLAADAQGKFWEFHDRVFADQKNLERPALEGHAKALGLDMNKFKTALDKGTYKDQVDADIKLGATVAVQGTPTLFVDGKRVSNPTDMTAVSAMIDQRLATN